MKNVLNKYIYLLFYSAVAGAQVDLRFIDHLSASRLQPEHLTYLNSLKISDTTEYLKAKYHLQYFNDSLLLYHYSRSVILSRADTVFSNQAALQLLREGKAVSAKNWFGSLSANNSAGARDISAVYRASLDPNSINGNELQEALRPSYNKYRKTFNKKPVTAAFLSAMVPGLGKLYAGKRASALNTFIISSVYAAQGIESYRKLGPTHLWSIVNYAAFTVFYFSNVYGGYNTVKEMRREHKKQFIADAGYYYN